MVIPTKDYLYLRGFLPREHHGKPTEENQVQLTQIQEEGSQAEEKGENKENPVAALTLPNETTPTPEKV